MKKGEKPHEEEASGQRFSLIPIEKIFVAQGRRALGDPTELMKSIVALGGLLQPICVDRNLRLISGEHRLEACKALGWKVIPAVIMELDKLRAELAEIDENIVRNNLTKHEEDQQLLRRKEIYEELHPDTKKGVAGGKASAAIRSGKSSTKPNPGFVADTAKKTRRSKSAIKESVKTATQLTPKARDLIPGTAVENNRTELKALSGCSPADQVKIMTEVKSGGAKSVRELMQKLGIGETGGVALKGKKKAGEKRNKETDEPTARFLSSLGCCLGALDDLNPGPGNGNPELFTEEELETTLAAKATVFSCTALREISERLQNILIARDVLAKLSSTDTPMKQSDFGAGTAEGYLDGTLRWLLGTGRIRVSGDGAEAERFYSLPPDSPAPSDQKPGEATVPAGAVVAPCETAHH